MERNDMLLKIVWQDGNKTFHECESVETKHEQEEITVVFNIDNEETYDEKAGAFFISTPQGWEKIA